MIPGLIASLARMPRRQLHLILCGLIAVMAALVWTILLRQPLAALRLQAEELSRLEQVDRNPAAQRSELAALERDAETLGAKLAAPGSRQGANELQITLIGELDRAAAIHGVRLSGAAPGPVRTVARLAEAPFDFEARGTYQDLFEWMTDVESKQPNVGIVRFDVRPTETIGQLVMKIRVSVYLLGGVRQ